MLTSNEEAIKHVTNPQLEELFRCLQQVKSGFFSGRLMVYSDDPDRYWVFNFYLGRLNWSGGGFYRLEWWRRHFLPICNQISEPLLEMLAHAKNPLGVSSVLAEILTKQVVERQSLNDVLSEMAIETLFDVIFACYSNEETLDFALVPSDRQEQGFGRSLPLLAIKPLIRTAYDRWQLWQKAGLRGFDPSLQLRVINPDSIPDLPLTVKQRQIITLINDEGDTVRDLALLAHEPSKTIAAVIYPFVKSGLLILEPPPTIERTAEIITSFNTNANPEVKPLIACIDDSQIVHHRMEQVLRPLGYRILCIQDPVKAIPLLIKNKPDLIFLDLVMPGTNGYEVCTQIRKTPSIKDTPVVILTSKDGPIDKLRAKMARSNNFTSKPIDTDAIVKMLFLYLPVTSDNN
jgi:two-component system, chemotaxis family, response regulator PixG